MIRPKLFFHIDQTPLKQSLTESDAAKKYLLSQSNTSDHWIDQVASTEANVAVVEVRGFSEQDYKRLMSLRDLSQVELLLLSDGEPNEFLDQAMRSGVMYHFRSPFNLAIIEETISDIFESLVTSEGHSQTIESSDLDQFGLLVGSSQLMRNLYRTVRKVASTEASVLLIGESGAGKELVANTIHLASQRREGPFLAINCGALSPELVDSELFGHVKGAFTGADRDHEGVFEQAKGGTLFLDEITEMPLEQQVKLLRVLEAEEFKPVGSRQIRKTDVRIVTASNRVLEEAINDGFIREDLFFRLSQFPIHVPPLREREGDIIGLAKHFLAYRNTEENQAKQVSDAALNHLSEYDWPGNVRELKYVIERAYILADDVIQVEHLLFESTSSGHSENISDVPKGMPLQQIEKIAIEQTLQDNDGNKSDTAEQLGISVKTLYNKLEKYQESDS